ncbi:hypothetical protein NDU88_002661 [Pleurodeles waltl]|uniref:Uncharacterized protein n=1 Tax=Pleurodeles waltl TaxID=8319 RepID=A0AAV7W4N7_PLEWA|nr:hypothetical protein NDU88_002661 [Pleurodeles waltl]
MRERVGEQPPRLIEELLQANSMGGSCLTEEEPVRKTRTPVAAPCGIMLQQRGLTPWAVGWADVSGQHPNEESGKQQRKTQLGTLMNLRPELLEDQDFRDAIAADINAYVGVNEGFTASCLLEWDAFKSVIRKRCILAGKGV